MTAVREAGLPAGFAVALDADTCVLDGSTVVGGQPTRVLRLSPGGARAWDELRAGRIASRNASRLARYLTDAGIAHPQPPDEVGAADVTVVVPVRDRADALDACLAGLGRAYPVVVVDDGSVDEQAVRAVADRHGARLIRRAVSGGPAAARNEGLCHARTEFVAFVDSDCSPRPDWIASLMAHFADPLVGAVAPRIVPIAGRGRAHRYAQRFGALDQGGRAGLVRPGARVSYVPTAALLARRSALEAIATGDEVFDRSLRYGEDVDAVWRLQAAGWRVRYDPSTEVAHAEPDRWRTVLSRRFAYGTSAAPLSRRHADAVAPLVVAPLPALAVVALASRRPAVAAAATVAAVVRTKRVTRLPLVDATRMTVAGAAGTWRGIGRYACQFLLPVLGVAALWPGKGRRGRGAAVVVLAAGGVDSVRFAPARVADHVAYGAGVLAGCRRERTVRPLRPVVVGRSRARAAAGEGQH